MATDLERVNVYLYPADMRALRRLSATQGVSVGAIARTLIHHTLEEGRRGGRLQLNLGEVDWPYPR